MSVRNMLKVVMSLLLAMTIAATADTHAARVDQSPASVSAAGKLNDKIPYVICIKLCPGVCTCDKRPPPIAQCTCSEPADFSDSNKPAALLHTSEETLQIKGTLEHPDLIPYTECMETCSNCACTRKWPPESNMCFCFKDDSVTKKAAAVADRLDHSFASVTEKTNELYEKLDLFTGPVPKRIGGDYKKMVLWTTSKMEGMIPYTECIETCEICACTLIWPLELSTCICGKPKPQAAGGKAVAK